MKQSDARLIAQLILALLRRGGGAGVAGAAVLALHADPTVTPTAGALYALGGYGGNLYLHTTASADVEWVRVGAGDFLATALLGEASGVARLGVDGIVPLDELPPFPAVTSNKGDLCTHDGSRSVVLPVGVANGMRLTVNSAAPNGIDWESDAVAARAGSIFSMDGPIGASGALVAYDFTQYDPQQTLAQNLAAANLSGNSIYNLVAVSTPAYGYSAGLGGAGAAVQPYMARALGGGLLTDGAGNAATTALGSNNALRITGALTLEALVSFGALATGVVQLCSMTSPGESLDTNTLYSLSLNNGVLTYGAEHDGGVNIDAPFSTTLLGSLSGATLHLALTRDGSGHVTVYVNGRRGSSLVTPTDAGGGGVIVPNRGASSTQNLVIGPAGASGALTWLALKITAAQFTDAQVQESYRRTFWGRP